MKIETVREKVKLFKERKQEITDQQQKYLESVTPLLGKIILDSGALKNKTWRVHEGPRVRLGMVRTTKKLRQFFMGLLVSGSIPLAPGVELSAAYSWSLCFTDTKDFVRDFNAFRKHLGPKVCFKLDGMQKRLDEKEKSLKHTRKVLLLFS